MCETLSEWSKIKIERKIVGIKHVERNHVDRNHVDKNHVVMAKKVSISATSRRLKFWMDNEIYALHVG